MTISKREKIVEIKRQNVLVDQRIAEECLNRVVFKHVKLSLEKRAHLITNRAYTSIRSVSTTRFLFGSKQL